MRDAKIANKLIQLKLIMKLNIKTIKYYEKTAKLNNAQNVKNTIIKHIFIKINNVAHIVRKNINSRNIFIRKRR